MRMLTEYQRKKTQTKRFPLLWKMVVLLVLVAVLNLQLAEAVTSGALYPSTAAITGTVTSQNNALTDNSQNAEISTNASSLTVSGFSMGSSAISINSITFYWDIPSYTGTASDDTVYFEYSLDNGTNWRTGSSYNTAQISSWTFPRLISFTDNTNIPANWTQADISKVRIRIRTVKTGQVDGTVNADVLYINVDYNIADSLPPTWPGTNTLSANGAGPTRVDLAWVNDATDNVGVTGWEIYRKLTSDGVWPGTPINTISGGANFYSDTTVSPQTFYDYRIRAKDGAGNTSSWSNVAGVITPADTTGPPWPSSNSLNTNVISGHQVDLSWTNDASDDVGVTGWEIHRKLNSETNWPETPIATAAGGVSSYSDSTVTDNTSYDYRIRAIDGSANVSIWSNIKNAVTPDMSPPLVTAETPANGSTAVLRGSLIKVTFNKAMNTSTFTIGNTFKVHDNTNNADITAGTLTFESENRTAVFDPTNPLPAGANLTVTVTTGAADMAGNTLASDYQWSFGTGMDVFVTPHGNFTANTKACGVCHKTHTGAGSNLIIIESTDELCYLCHDAGGLGSVYTVEDDFDAGLNTSTHKVPVSQKCTDCHNPHLDSATRPKLLQTAKGAVGDEQFCWSCHGTGSVLATDAGQDPAGNANDHQSYYPQDGTGHDASSLLPASGTMVKCSRCHEEHGSDFTKLLTDPQGSSPATFTENNKSFCYECHTGAKSGADSGWDGQAVNDNNRGHGQVCTTCHDPHGTPNDNNNIFTYSITPVGTTRDNINFPYKKSDYNQCWNGGCHQGADTTLTQTTKTAGATPTGFWQDDLFQSSPTDVRVNLHNFHLNLDQYRPGRGNVVCKECHRPHGVLTNENPDMAKKVGFPSSTVTANSFSAPRYDFLDKEAGDPNDGGSCNLSCHSYTHTDVSYANGGVSVAPGPSPGGQDCMDSCHNDNLVRDMGTTSSMYRHLVESPQATYNEDATNPSGKTTCLSMCHTDHDIFNSQMGTASSPMLRSSGGSTATPPTSGISAAQVNTTCLASACHGGASTIDDPDYMSPSGNTSTSAIGSQVNASLSGFHPINIPTTSGPSNSYAQATLVAPWNTVTQLKCTDCHSQEAAPFGAHASNNRYMLKRQGPQSIHPSFQLYDALCVMCHSQTVYGYGNAVGTGNGSRAPNTHKVGQHYTGEFGCMECHGGNPEFGTLASQPYNAAAQRGSIHGWSYTYPTRSNPANGFVNGLTISDYDPVVNTCAAKTGNSNCNMNAKAIQ